MVDTAVRYRMLVLLLLLLVACASCTADDATPDPTVTPERRPTASATSTPESAPTPQGTGRAPAAASPACRNSTSQDCGSFSFEPEPEDEPLVLRVSFEPAAPKVGDTVTFTLRATDADSRHLFLGTYEFTEDGPGKIGRDDFGVCRPAFGPWDPPPAKSGSATKTLRHAYTEAGTFEATFTFFSHSYARGDHPWPSDPPGDADGHCVDPYRSSGKADATIVVR